MFNICGRFKVTMKNKCNYFDWFDEEISNYVKGMIRSLKNMNNELIQKITDIKKKEKNIVDKE